MCISCYLDINALGQRELVLKVIWSCLIVAKCIVWSLPPIKSTAIRFPLCIMFTWKQGHWVTIRQCQCHAQLVWPQESIILWVEVMIPGAWTDTHCCLLLIRCRLDLSADNITQHSSLLSLMKRSNIKIATLHLVWNGFDATIEVCNNSI